MSISVVVAGGRGRIGSVIADQVLKSSGFELSATLNSQSTESEKVALVEQGFDLFVDATHPGVSEQNISWALSAGANVLVATSGWDQVRISSLEKLVAKYPKQGVLIVPNFSLGSILATRLSAVAAHFFPSLEISETHHAKKKDAPSGTAIRTVEKIIAAIKESGQDVITPDSKRIGDIDSLIEGIPVHSYRRDDVPTTQQVDFHGHGEALTINHEVYSYDAYRQGISYALQMVTEVVGVEIGLEKFLGLD